MSQTSSTLTLVAPQVCAGLNLRRATHPDLGVVILKYAGNDATAAYDEIHAPGILEETLSPEAHKGLLDQTDIINLPQDQQDDIQRIEKTTGQIPLPQRYEKPELHKLISIHDFEQVAQKTLTVKAWAVSCPV